MDRHAQPRRDLKPVLAAAAIFLSAGLSIASMFLMTSPDMPLFGHPEARVLTLTSSLVLLCACVLVSFRPNIGYGLGGIAALLGLPWFVLTESGMMSIWSVLNGPDPFSERFVPFARLKILSVALLAMALTFSILRLLPPALVRRAHLSGRTWPAVAVGVVVAVVWMCRSAMPWMLPEIVDFGGSPGIASISGVPAPFTSFQNFATSTTE